MGVRSQSLWMEISKQEGVWGSFLWSIEPFLWGSKFDSPESHQAQPITTAYQHKRLGFPALKIRKIFLVLMSVLYPLLIPLYLCHSFSWPVSALIHAKNRCCQYQQPCVLLRVSRIWGGGGVSPQRSVARPCLFLLSFLQRFVLISVLCCSMPHPWTVFSTDALSPGHFSSSVLTLHTVYVLLLCKHVFSPGMPHKL